MQELSDSSNRLIIIIIFAIYYIYLKYQQIQLKMTKNFTDIKCNPLDMIVGGIVNEQEASKTFTDCLNYTTAENTSKSIADAQKQQTEDITKTIDDIKSNQKSEYSSLRQEQRNLFKLMNTKASDMNDLIAQQQAMNATLVSTSGPIKTMVEQIGTLSTQLKDIAQKIFDNTDTTETS